MFKGVHPVLPCKDVAKTIEFYVKKLGFSLSFQDANEPKYAGVKRDNVELHLQWHESEEWERIERPMLRFLVDDVDALHDEYKGKGVFHDRTVLCDTTWGTREFAFFDPNNNGLTFYTGL